MEEELPIEGEVRVEDASSNNFEEDGMNVEEEFKS